MSKFKNWIKIREEAPPQGGFEIPTKPQIASDMRNNISHMSTAGAESLHAVFTAIQQIAANNPNIIPRIVTAIENGLKSAQDIDPIQKQTLLKAITPQGLKMTGHGINAEPAAAPASASGASPLL